MLQDEGRGFAELIDLSMRHNAGQISDDEFAQQEAQLLERLSLIRERRTEVLLGEGDVDEDAPFETDPSVEEVDW
jgi:hypothetical protein